MTERSLHRSAAAWTLVRHFVQQNLREQGLRLQDAWLTCQFFICRPLLVIVIFNLH